MASLVADARNGAALNASFRECAFEVPTVDPVLGINGNRDRLLAALMNLLQNAFNFTRSHTKITMHPYAAGDRVLIDVKDNRGGDKAGLGLGLSIARANVETNKGVLNVRNVPGTGCVFTINLPLHAPRISHLVRQSLGATG